MLFDTPVYFVFLILVVAVYWNLPHRGQNVFLLVASYFFYGWWDWRFLFLMAGSTIIDFWVARGIEGSASAKVRKRLLVLSLVLNFGFLGYFKYLNFFLDSFTRVASLLGAHNIPSSLIRIILPPAISFYTFQEVAYIVDVYKGRIKAADSLIDYALFISLFPHLIAGPIQRPSHLLPQVQSGRKFDPERFFQGCMLIVTGLFRKCIIADNCAVLANAAFNGQFARGWGGTLIGVYAFAFQIYGDFSGYSDLARGSAQLLGFHFMVNFRQPYLATSLQDFWRRWHISLSSWLRDYLYIPLGGSRLGERRTYFNLLATMLLGGLWHGANWTFVFWGALHGGALAAERWFRIAGTAGEGWAGTWVRRIIVFNFVCFTWVFFRASSLRSAWSMLRELTNPVWNGDFAGAALFLAGFIALALTLDVIVEHYNIEYPFQNAPPVWQMAAAAAGVVLIALLGLGQLNAFIYFQF
jgi:D-alanyl-lipoteichoic acid acyltransferase DltB (MBOAT superfamily)